MKPIKAIYAFSGDPITFGHIHIIDRSAKLFQDVVVGIGINPAKKYLFSIEDRLKLAQDALSNYGNVTVVAFKGLLVDYAFEHNIPVIIRGLRNTEDFNMEVMLHQIGESQKMNVETIFLPSNHSMSHISSGAAKALQLEQGLVFEYVPLNVKQKLEEELSNQFIVGVTGEIGCGKSFVCEKLVKIGKLKGMPIHSINVDKIGHQILESLSEPIYKEFREQIIKVFGDSIQAKDGFINTKVLGKIIFADPYKLKLFNEMIEKPMLLKLRRELYGKKGIILIDSALIAESKMSYVCNNNIILISAKRDVQLNRLADRGYSTEQLIQRASCQYTHDAKMDSIESTMQKDNYGKLFLYDNSGNDNEDINAIFTFIIKYFTNYKKLESLQKV